MATERESDGTEPRRAGLARRALRFVGRWTRRLATLTLVLVVLGAILYLTRDRTLHPLVVRFAPTVSRAFSPYEVHLESLEGDWFGWLRANGVRVEATTPEGPVRTATVEEITVEGDLVALARSRDLDELDAVKAVAPRVEIDLTRPSPPSTSDAGNDAIALPSVEVERGEVRIATATDVLEVTEIDARSEGGTPARFAVRGRATANAWEASVRGAATLADDGSLAFSVDVPEGRVQDLALTLEGAAGTLRPGGLDVDDGVLRFGANEVRVVELRIESDDDGAPLVGGAVTFDVPRIDEARETLLAAFGRAVDAPGVEEPLWFGSARGTIALTPRPGHRASGTIDVDGSDVVLAGLRLGEVEARLVGDDSRITAETLRATDPGRAFVDATGTFVLEERSLETVRASVQFDEPEVYAPGLEFLGEIDAQFALDGPIESPSGTVRVRAGKIEAGGRSVGDLELDGVVTDGVVDVTRLTARTDHGVVEASGLVGLPLAGRALDVSLRSGSIARGDARLEVVDGVSVQVDGPALVIDDLRLAGSGGELEVDLASRPGAGLTATVEARGLRLAPFLAKELGSDISLGRVDGSIGLTTVPLAADVDLTFEGAKLAGSDEPLGGRVRATWRDDRIELSETRLNLRDASADLVASAPLALSGAPLQSGDVRIEGTLRMRSEALRTGLLRVLVPEENEALVARTRGAAALTLDLSGEWRDLRGTGALELEGIDLRTADGERMDAVPSAIDGVVALRIDDAIELMPSQLSASESIRIECSGRIARALDVTSLVEDPDAWLAAPVDATARVECEDLRWVSSIDRELRETTGTLEAEGRLGGTLGALRPEGDVRVKDGSLRYRGAPPVEGLDVVLSVTPEGAAIERTTFLVGASEVDVEGRLALDGDTPSVELTIEGDDVLLFRSPDARIRADVDLAVRGPVSGLRVDGGIALVGGRVRSPVEFQRILTSGGGDGGPRSVRRGISLPPLGPSSIKLNVAVTTADPMRLEGRLTRGEIRTDLRLLGDASHPIPSGRIFLDPLEIAVPAGVIEFPTGLVQFDPDTPDIPTVELVGTTRLAGYDVTVDVTGDYDQPEVEFSAVPPLSPDDLILLVLSGQPPAAGRGAAAAGQQVAIYVATDIVRGWFDSGGFEDGDRESFMDRIEVVSGRDVSRGGMLTIQASYRLKEGFARERDALYAVVERDAFEDYNFGVRLVLRLR